MLAHGGDSRVVLTSRVVPALAPPPGPPVAGDFAARLLKLPIHALGLDEAAVLARQLPNLGTLLKGRGGADDDTREVDRQLVVRTLNLVQGHPKLIELAEAQAADTEGLAGHLERAEGAWAAEGVGTGELASFFAAGESHVGADQFLRALAGWTDSVAATLPAAARTLFQVLCCCEDEDRESRVIEPTWPEIWKRLALAGDPPDLAATLAPLVQVGLVDERPAAPTGDATAAPTVRHFAIHPGVAEAGRAAAGEGIQAAVDVELAAFWNTQYRGGLERESEGGGSMVTLAGRRAAPYLMRRQEWRLASTLLEGVLHRDKSPATVAAVLPMLGRIAEATKGTDRELVDAGVLARAFLAAGRRDEAEALMREVLARAAACGDYRLASGTAGHLIGLLHDSGRPEEALGLLETMKEATHRAGFGPWTQLADEVRRLQLLSALGRYDEVLAEVEALRPRMDALPLTGAQDEAVTPWNVRETLLSTGRSAATSLERWEQVLSLNAEIIASKEARGAPSYDVVRSLFNDYGPLSRLGRYGNARELLMGCRSVFEAEQDLPGLGGLQCWLALKTNSATSLRPSDTSKRPSDTATPWESRTIVASAITTWHTTSNSLVPSPKRLWPTGSLWFDLVPDRGRAARESGRGPFSHLASLAPASCRGSRTSPRLCRCGASRRRAVWCPLRPTPQIPRRKRRRSAPPGHGTCRESVPELNRTVRAGARRAAARGVANRWD